MILLKCRNAVSITGFNQLIMQSRMTSSLTNCRDLLAAGKRIGYKSPQNCVWPKQKSPFPIFTATLAKSANSPIYLFFLGKIRQMLFH